MKLIKWVKTQTTVTGNNDSNIVSSYLKFVNFLLIIDQIILNNLQVELKQ